MHASVSVVAMVVYMCITLENHECTLIIARYEPESMSKPLPVHNYCRVMPVAVFEAL